MDPITHSLTGGVLARSGIRQRIGGEATVALVLASIFPDIDVVSRFWGVSAAIRNHRGITHSFLVAPVFALFIAFMVYKFGSYKRLWNLFGLCLMGMYLHIFFDLCTSYGTQIFAPLTTRMYSLDIIVIVDFYFSSILLLGLVGSLLFKRRASLIAGIGIFCLAGYILLSGVNHSLALRQVKRATAEEGVSFIRASAFPQFLSPFRWRGVVETKRAYYRSTPFTIGSEVIEFVKYAKTPPNIYIEIAHQLEEVRVFQWFAQYPLTLYQQKDDQHLVRMVDLRFRSPEQEVGFASVLVVLDKDGAVVEKRVGF